jgi:hypothetical protein
MSTLHWKKISGGTEVLAIDWLGKPVRSITHPSVYQATGRSGTVYRIKKEGMGWLNDWGQRNTLRGAKSNAESWEGGQA